MGMRAVVEIFGKFCIVRWTGRDGLSAKAKTYCGDERSIGTEGVLQLPDEIPCCDACEHAVKTTITKLTPKKPTSSS